MTNIYNEKDFNIAVKMFEQEYSQQELIEFLNTGDTLQKQTAALQLCTISSKEDALSLVKNLTKQEGKVRETVSFKIKEFMSDKKLIKYFEQQEIYSTLLDATTDINGNTCRNTISAINNLVHNQDFTDYFCSELIKLTNALIQKIQIFETQDGKFKTNQIFFKLYWCLETIYTLSDYMPLEDLKKILLLTKDINEYTIREKTAKILTKNFNDDELSKIKQELKNDPNYYVRRY